MLMNLYQLSKKKVCKLVSVIIIFFVLLIVNYTYENSLLKNKILIYTFRIQKNCMCFTYISIPKLVPCHYDR